MNSKTKLFNDDRFLNLNEAKKSGAVVMANDALSSKVGFRIDVVYSSACFERHVQWLVGSPCQNQTGREWDVLMLSALALHMNVNEAGQANTKIESVPPGGESPQHDELRVSWLGDEDDEPVVLVMLIHETVSGINRRAAVTTAGANHV